MMFLQLLAQLVSGKQVPPYKAITSARSGLDDISSVFRDTINKYRYHATKTKEAAELFAAQAEDFQMKEALARATEQELMTLADSANKIADKIESSLGFDLNGKA